MRKNRLGRSSIVVSEICMGTMTFGSQADEKTSFRIMALAGGVLSGKYNDGDFPDGARFTYYRQAPERQQAILRRFVNERTLESTRRYQAIAQQAGMSLVTMATAWSKQHDFVASTIVGATSPEQMPDILAAADLTLDQETLKKIDAVSREILYPMG